MRKKKEREPDFFQFSVEYSLDNDSPVERHYMALNSADALKMFAHGLLKPMFGKVFEESQIESFQQAFAVPGNKFDEQPELIPVPEPLPELELPDVEEETPNTDLSPETLPETKKDSQHSEELSVGEILDNEVNEENIFEMSQIADNKPTKPDPVALHKEKMRERDAEIDEINRKNELTKQRHRDSLGLTLEMMEQVNNRLEVLNFSQYNRWADRWEKLPFPPEKCEEENEEDSST